MRKPGFPLALSLMTILVLAASISSSQADAITYDTQVFDGPEYWPFLQNPSEQHGKIIGQNVVRLEGVSGGSYDGAYNASSAPMSLGRFVVDRPTSGTTTYENVPFTIQWTKSGWSGINWKPPGESQWIYHIEHATFGLVGRLNGRVDADGHSTLTATLDTIDNRLRGVAYPAIPLVFHNTLPYRLGDLQVGSEAEQFPLSPLPEDLGSGWFPQMQWRLDQTIALTSPEDGGVTTLTAKVIPEPATIALLLTAGAGIGLRRRFKAKDAV